MTWEAYSHEAISFGFWAGDAKVRIPMYYSYTWPEPADLVEHPLRPAEAGWVETGSSHQARLSYDDVRTAESPRAVLLDFSRALMRRGRRPPVGTPTRSAHTGRPGCEEAGDLLQP